MLLTCDIFGAVTKCSNLEKPLENFSSDPLIRISLPVVSVINSRFDGADPFSEGMAAVLVGKKWGYIDKTGKIVIEPQFAGNRAFGDELAPVLVDQ